MFRIDGHVEWSVPPDRSSEIIGRQPVLFYLRQSRVNMEALIKFWRRYALSSRSIPFVHPEDRAILERNRVFEDSQLFPFKNYLDTRQFGFSSTTLNLAVAPTPFL